MWSQFNNNFPGAIQCLNADSLSSLEDSPMKVEECHTLEQLYRALCQRGVLRVALLTGSSTPVEDVFGFIKERLLGRQSVSVALFYDRVAH